VPEYAPKDLSALFLGQPDGTTGPRLPATADTFLVVAKGAAAVTRWQAIAP
jgi:hypothetical protein